MGNATSSALRTDDPVTSATAPGADGPAFGSLSTLGGPRKFKKKPVLVLDPEDLEKAHMLFQDASAELLGEDVERPERSAPLLGLAPMDMDGPEAEAADTSDDDTDISDDDLPSAEDVLRMTASRPAPVESDAAAIAEQLEGLDFDHRIFASLPLKPEDQSAAEEEAERLAATRAAPTDDATQDGNDKEDHFDAPLDRTANHDPDARIEKEGRALAIDPSPAPEAHGSSSAPFDLDRAAATAPKTTPTFPVDPLPEPEAELATPHPTDNQSVGDTPPDTQIETSEASEPVASAQAVFGDRPFLDFPSQHVSWVPQDTSTQEAEPDSEGAKVDPTLDRDVAGTAEEVDEPSNHFEWAYEDEEDQVELDQNLASEDQHSHRHYPDPETESEVLPEPQGDGSYTEVEDDQVDGYAFMYAHNPRGRTIHALAEGESNSLRAKLIKEREAELTPHDEFEGKPSIWARFTVWLRGLLG